MRPRSEWLCRLATKGSTEHIRNQSSGCTRIDNLLYHGFLYPITQSDGPNLKSKVMVSQHLETHGVQKSTSFLLVTVMADRNVPNNVPNLLDTFRDFCYSPCLICEFHNQ